MLHGAISNVYEVLAIRAGLAKPVKMKRTLWMLIFFVVFVNCIFVVFTSFQTELKDTQKDELLVIAGTIENRIKQGDSLSELRADYDYFLRNAKYRFPFVKFRAAPKQTEEMLLHVQRVVDIVSQEKQ